MEHLSKKNLNKYLRYYRNILIIPKSWEIKIKLDNEIDEYANVEWEYKHKKFTININPNKTKTLDDLKDSIIHELLHILFSPTSTKIHSTLNKIAKREKINIIITKKNFDKIEELLIIHLSGIIFNIMKGSNNAKK